MKNTTFRIAFFINLLLLGGTGLAAGLATPSEPLANSANTLLVSRGMTLTQIMRAHYPDRRAQWGQLINQIVRSNPQAFDNGDPATLKLGARLSLPPNASAGQSIYTAVKQRDEAATDSIKPAVLVPEQAATEQNSKADSARAEKPMANQKPVETSVVKVRSADPTTPARTKPSRGKVVASSAATSDTGDSKPLYASLEPNVEALDLAGEQRNAESTAEKVLNMSAGKAEVPYWWMGASSLLLFALFL